jgi:hypothetical protein
MARVHITLGFLLSKVHTSGGLEIVVAYRGALGAAGAVNLSRQIPLKLAAYCILRGMCVKTL